MSFEGVPPNSFRATVLSGVRRTPVTTDKKPGRDSKAQGLNAVQVQRLEPRRSNQRGGDRHRLHDNQATVRRKGREHSVELINLSRGGAMIAGKIGAKLWEPLDLILGEFGTVECAVRWIRQDRYGLEFAHETRIECDPEVEDQVLRDVIRNCFPDVESEINDVTVDDPAEPSRGRRHPLIWNAIVYHDYESDVVRLRNISAGGVLIDCGTTLPEGVTVFLELDGVDQIPATVCWSQGGQSGLAFQEPFDLYRLSNATPELASMEWLQPDYLRQEWDEKEDQKESSPWADRWGRLTLSELKYTLRG
ncbi:MAG: PilZ domain-containing protein [Sphingomicrobium sp.]